MPVDPKSRTVNTPPFRGSYLNLFTAKKNDLNGKMQFSAMALFKKGEKLTVLENAAKAAIQERWGDDPTKWPKGMRNPFRDQAEREKEGVMPDGHEAGAIFMTFSTDEKPGQPGPAIFDQANQRVTAADQTRVYSGCWLQANVTAAAYPSKNSKVQNIKPGVAFYLNAVQLVKDDTPLGNRPNVENAFAPIEGAAEATAQADAGGLFDSMA